MSRRFENPWANPVGEVLCTILTGVLRYVPKLYDTPSPESPEDQPALGFVGEKWCVDCKARTTHREYHWRTEDETTIECDLCGGVFLGEL